MISGKMVTLIYGVFNRTREGKLNWEETTTEGVYQASFPNYSIQIYEKSGPNSTDYVLGIYNQEGKLVDEVADPDFAQSLEDSREAFALMREIYQTARRTALGIESALDELIAALEEGASSGGLSADEIPF